jgi:aryl-alcohol dehydrogenase-like predicted oxidoreductase
VSDLPVRPLGDTGLDVSAIGFGSFKIGRNQGIKYPTGYELPSGDECARLLDGILALGINLIDTAPAYGEAEVRIGNHLASRRDEFVLSSKVGERFIDGVSHYEFGSRAVRESVEESLRRLQTDHLDLLLIHSDGNDLRILQETDTVDALLSLKEQGKTRSVGLSGKTVEGAAAALDWADVLMVEFHLQDTSHRDVMRQAHERGIGVLVKKGLAAGHLDPAEAIRFVLSEPSVDSLVLGGLNLEHFRANCRIASEVRTGLHDEFV